MFHDIPKVQVIISIDKQQLEHAVRQIFGEKTDVDHYLAKFIAFEIKLTEGSIDDAELFNLRFREYLNRFEYQQSHKEKSEIEEYQTNFFAGMDMRSRIAIIDKCLLLHDLLTESDERADCLFSCIELFLAVIKYDGVDTNKSRKSFSKKNPFLYEPTKEPSAGLAYMVNKLNDPNCQWNYYYTDSHGRYVSTQGILGDLLTAYTHIIGLQRAVHYKPVKPYHTKLREYTIDFWNLLQTIC